MAVDLLISYTGSPKVIPSVSEGPLVEVIGSRMFPEARHRPVTQQEVMNYAPSKDTTGFFHTWIIMN